MEYIKKSDVIKIISTGYKFDKELRDRNVLLTKNQLLDVLNEKINELPVITENQIREDAIDYIVCEIIFPLLDEYDRSVWENISYIELAQKYIEALNNNIYPTVKNIDEELKESLKKWVLEQLKEK